MSNVHITKDVAWLGRPRAYGVQNIQQNPQIKVKSWKFNKFMPDRSDAKAGYKAGGLFSYSRSWLEGICRIDIVYSLQSCASLKPGSRCKFIWLQVWDTLFAPTFMLLLSRQSHQHSYCQNLAYQYLHYQQFFAAVAIPTVIWYCGEVKSCYPYIEISADLIEDHDLRGRDYIEDQNNTTM